MNVSGTVDLLHLFGDATRVRLVALLARQELTVAEITHVTQLPQSRVSTHLGKLREAEVLRDRREGTSTFYALNEPGMPEDARRLWQLMSTRLDDAVLESDGKRSESVVRARSGRWPEPIAGEMERHYSPGRTWEATARAFMGLLSLGDVLDVGAGDGTIAQMIAPQSRSYVAIDASEKLVAAATARLHGAVKVVHGDAHALPFDDASFDQVLLLNVLTSVEHPAKVVAEAARVLRRHGTVAVVTLDAHDQASVTASYGHLHAGFRPATLRRHLEKAGLVVRTCEVTSRERRAPHFGVVTAFATKGR